MPFQHPFFLLLVPGLCLERCSSLRLCLNSEFYFIFTLVKSLRPSPSSYLKRFRRKRTNSRLFAPQTIISPAEGRRDIVTVVYLRQKRRIFKLERNLMFEKVPYRLNSNYSLLVESCPQTPEVSS